jgi:catechol 2,3-dioxygenase-like lactoylglutathione lyase family enzyme
MPSTQSAGGVAWSAFASVEEQESEMRQPRIQHVSIPRPLGTGDQARAFYGDILGLPEVPRPQALSQLDLVWYRLGDTEIHLFGEEPREDTSGRHFCIAFDNLEEIRERLVAAGYQPQETIPIPSRPRFFCRDPFGNSIEFTTVKYDYLKDGE